jgi:hypothetical protein
MEECVLQFGVEKAKLNRGALIRDVMRGPSPSAGETFENYSGGQSVVIHKASGEKRVLGVTKTVKEARERATAIQLVFNSLGTAEWCERYQVPLSFVSG